MHSNTARIAQISTFVRLSNLYTDVWLNTEEPSPQDRI